MAGYKINRTVSDLKLSISEHLKDVKDPRVSRFLSIVKIDLSNDLSYATVYISALEGMEKSVESAKVLNKGAAGYIRKQIGASLHLRKTPEFRFVADDSIEKSAEISRILNSIDIPPAPVEDEDDE